MEKLKQIVLEPSSNFGGEVQVPGSKSISNRVMLMAALAKGKSELSGLLESDDTRYMREAVPYVIAGKSDKPISIFLGNAGTAYRFLTATLCLGQGEYILDGEPRMRERPIKDLADVLKILGADIEYLGNEGYPPIKIKAKGLNGGSVSIRGNISSQFLTALLIAAPYCRDALEINVEGELISKPYIYMTTRLMEKFGVEVKNLDGGFKKFLIPKGEYKPQNFQVEGDASSASYFLAGAAITGKKVVVKGVGKDSLQGDAIFADVLSKMETCEGLRGITINANNFPDAAMTICPVACYAKGKTTITGIASWKVKETDRIKAMAAELRKIGADVESSDDSISIIPPQGDIQNAVIETYKDHRMAMCFSLFSLNSSHKKGAKITILDPACVNKTFPEYFNVFASLRSPLS